MPQSMTVRELIGELFKIRNQDAQVFPGWDEYRDPSEIFVEVKTNEDIETGKESQVILVTRHI
ncbi:MAG: hypothetical protein OXO51_04960 [Gemmatimonadota bacterium]|nr:hypothetical protein [Gemmatimonadota bacterium]